MRGKHGFLRKRVGMDEDLAQGTPQRSGADAAPADGAQPVSAARTPYQPYRRQVRHITQEPIDDVEPDYVTLDRYETLEDRRARRGGRGARAAASGTPAPASAAGQAAAARAAYSGSGSRAGARSDARVPGASHSAARAGNAAPPRSGAAHKHMGVATSDPSYMPDAKPEGAAAINYSRYLETPKPGKTLFAGRGRRKPWTRFVPLVVALAVVLAVAWFLFLR